ncbi:MAG: HlyD family secretion protein [Bacillota bacterium]|jgi:HlyD family secretion protein|nr:HlyD family secretion protein [Bacillota bacterium]MDK2925633.1 HlyD family secretion protein [Bacillota bacterium]
MSKPKAAKIIALVATAGMLLLGGCSQGGTAQTNGGSNGLVYQGSIEAQEVSINSKIPGRIAKLYVTEGQEVKAGQVLAEIASDELKAKEKQALALVQAAQASYEAAKGQVAAAQAMLDKAKNGARKQEIAQAQEYYDLAVKTYERVQQLYEKGAVSAQKRDEAKTQMDIAAQKLSLALEGARSEDISAAQAMVIQAKSMEQAALAKLQEAQGGLQEVRAYLKDTRLVSPINGTITELNVDEGELVSTGMAIATVSDLHHPWIEVNVKETDLGKISLGQRVQVRLPSYPNEVFQGRVTRINKKPDFAVKRATNDNGSFDIVAFGVKVEIDDKGKALRPGMTAFVTFSK